MGTVVIGFKIGAMLGTKKPYPNIGGKEMPIFKLTVTTQEEWEHHYEIVAADLEEAKAMAEQEIQEPIESHRNEVTITSIMDEDKKSGK